MTSTQESSSGDNDTFQLNESSVLPNPSLEKSASNVSLNQSADSLTPYRCLCCCGIHLSFLQKFLITLFGVGIIISIGLIVALLAGENFFAGDTKCWLQALIGTLLTNPITAALTWVTKEYADKKKKNRSSEQVAQIV